MIAFRDDTLRLIRSAGINPAAVGLVITGSEVFAGITDVDDRAVAVVCWVLYQIDRCDMDRLLAA